MNARSVVAGLAILALVVPTVGAVHGSSQHSVDCGDETGASAGEVEVTVTTGEDCGASLDSSDGNLTVVVTVAQVEIDNPAYPTTLTDAIPDRADPEEGIEHPLRSFLSSLDDAFEEISDATEAGVRPDIWTDDAGVHVAAGDEQADVAWPRDPMTGRKLVDDERVYVPSQYRVSSDAVVAFVDRACRSVVDDGPCPVAVLDRVPVDIPSIIAGGGLGDATNTGPASYVVSRAAGGSGSTTRASGSAPAARIDLDTASATGLGDGADVVGATDAASNPTPVPGESLPVAATVATAALVALGALAGYRRLKDGEILEHSLRHRIYDYILENPGATVQEISDALGVDYSTADHHASVLHDFDLIHRREQGRISHYFENHGTFDAFEKEAIPLLRNGTSSRIARVVRENPKITPSAVARELDVDPSTVKWHVDKLRGADLMDTEPLDGRSIGLQVPEPARDLVDRWA